ncbi:retropepsin-like aspartic protease family protein [Catenovulum adriaticum]|uniref:Retroviral-like aspartic protease family protein n=1 Tax=Catenovulum adriaticum TaxID=2984846 RepID=A0ABY7ANY3_9ALTE|nr:retropepsin-like aspartic protease [Catenovulum sp. TS8]WAJ70366.1 retroviral-like aspartic protease family protein [Catenovulum sp. TS8]
MTHQFWRRLSIVLMALCVLSGLANWLLFNAWQQNSTKNIPLNTGSISTQPEQKWVMPELNSSSTSKQIKIALQRWSELRQDNPELANNWQQAWVNQATIWLSDNQTSVYLALLTEWKAIAPDLLALSLLEYNWYLTQNQLGLAADIIYSVIDRLDAGQYRQAQLNKLVQLLNQTMETVLAQQNCETILETLQMLVWYDDSQPEYIYALSQCYIQLNEFKLAQQQLIYLLADPQYQEQAEQLIAQIERSTDEPVPLAKAGEHFIVQAKINQNASVALMIDTGASVTSLSRNKFAQLNLGYQTLGYRTLSTAGGLTQAELIEVETFSVGNKQLNDFKLAILDIDSFAGSDGLLGMNFLSRFPFVIEQQQKRLKFSKK